MGKKKGNIYKTAKRYAIKLMIDIKDDLLFGEELFEYIVASVKHDTGKSYHNERFYFLCEEAILDLYDRYVVQCPCCKKYIHKDYTVKVKKQKHCIECGNKLKKQRRRKQS